MRKALLVQNAISVKSVSIIYVVSCLDVAIVQKKKQAQILKFIFLLFKEILHH